MVKTLLLGLLVATICGIAYGSPATDPQLSFRPDPSEEQPEDIEDPAARSERSTNLTGTARRIQMFIKNRHLQILPDGTVNGTTDNTSPYSILQRTTVGIGRMKIQGLATCQYLCMSRCGLLYGSRDFSDECVFNETIEQSNYNTYSSCKYSNDKRTFYLALNQRGQSRKVMLRARRQLGKLSSYILVLTKNYSPEAQAHPIRHHAHGCPPAAARMSHRPPSFLQHCPKRKKRKKRKRKCPGDDENDPESCQKRLNAPKHKSQNRNNVKCLSDKNSELCQRDVNNKKRKTNVSDKSSVMDPKRKKKNRKGVKRRLNPVEAELMTTTTTMSPTSTVISDYPSTPDEDYVIDTSTHADWDDAKNTISPLSDSD